MVKDYRAVLQICVFAITTMQFVSLDANAQSSAVPAPLADILNKREEVSSNFDMTWHTRLKASYLGEATSDTVVAKELEWRKVFSREYRKQGFVDQTSIDKMVKSRVESIGEGFKPHSVDVTASLQFARKGQITLVVGTVPGPPELILPVKFTQLYDGKNGLIVQNSNPPTFTSPLNPVAWMSQGNSTHFRSPAPIGLYLTPEHFIGLANSCPLGLYDGSWRLASTTKDAWVLTSRVKPPDDGFINYKITLSRSYGGAVVEIDAKPESNASSQTWHITNFRRYEKMWIGRTVNCVSLSPGLGKSNQIWELDSIRPSEITDVKLPHLATVQDYRLFGPSLTKNVFLNADTRKSSKIVFYNWNGNFPSIDDLKTLFQQQHPGESSPDPGKTSSANLTPFLGGMFCLVGGVWMFKRRSQS